jgi:hypothetical protein
MAAGLPAPTGPCNLRLGEPRAQRKMIGFAAGLVE